MRPCRLLRLSAFAPALALLLAGCGWGFLPGHNPADPIVVKLAAVRASIPIGDAQQLTATVTGGGIDTVQWSVNGIVGGNSTFGTISSTGLYTTPATVPANPTVGLTATSLADTGISATTTMLVTPPIISLVSVTCSPATILNSQTAQCSSTVQGDGSFTPAVTWSVDNIAGGDGAVGTISAQGLYQAPDPIPSASITISAVSQQDSSKQGSASIGLLYPMPVVSNVTPSNILWLGPSTQIQVMGSNFSHVSTMLISGTSIPTTYISSSQLAANVPASTLKNLGSVQVAVSTAGPGGGISGPGSFSVVGGSMNVTLNNLPSEAATSIQVAGPQSYNKTLGASGTLTGLPAGIYTITAATGSTSDSTFPPDQPVQSATIASLTPVGVAVNYSTGVFKAVKILDVNGMSSLAFVAGQTAFMVNQSSAIGMSLHAGDTLIIPDCAAAPGGAIIKVVTASLSFDQVLVNFTPGALGDVFSQMNLQLSTDLTADALPYIVKAAPGVSISKSPRIRLAHPDSNPGSLEAQPQDALASPCQDNWLTVELDGEIDLSSNQVGDDFTGQTQATASGTLQICPSILLTVHKQWYELVPDGLRAEVKFAEYGHLAISDEAGVALGAEKQLFQIKGVAIPIGPPGSLINLQPVVTATIGATGKVSGRFTAGGEQTVTGGFGVDYENNTWTPFADPLQTQEALDDTQFAANASTEVYIKARIELDLNAGLGDLDLASVGVYVEPKVYVLGTVDTTANPWWSISGGIDSGVGVTASVFDGVWSHNYPGPVTPLWTQVFSTSGGPLPMSPILNAIAPASPTSQAAPQNIDLTGSGFAPDMTLTACLSAHCNTVSVTTNSAASASASVALNRSGSWTFQLKAPGSAASGILRATVLPPAVLPVVTAVDGASSSFLQVDRSKQTINILGTDFQDGLQVKLCGVACYPPLQGTQIGTVTPTEAVSYATLARSGPWSVSILNPDGGTSAPFKFTVQPAFGATVFPGSGIVNSTQFAITGVGATPNGSITRTTTLPDGSTQSNALAADASGAFGATFTVAAPGPYVETFADTKGAKQTVPITYSAVAAPATGDFTLSSSASSQTATPGSMATFTLNAVSTGGFSGTLTPSVANLAAATGSTASWLPPTFSVASGGQGTSILTIQTSSTTPTGSYPVSLVATSGSISHSVPVTLIVSSAQQPQAPTATTGSAASSGASAESLTGTVNPNGASTQYQFVYANNLALSGAQATPLTNAGTGTTSQSVFANITGLSAGATYYYQLQAKNSAGAARGVVLSFTADASGSPDFSTTVNTTSQNIAAGQSASFVVTFVSTGGFTGNVTPEALNWQAQIPGATASWSPALITLPANSSTTSTFVIATPATAAAGTYSGIVLEGVSGSTTHAAPSVAVVVTSSQTIPTTPTGLSPGSSTFPGPSIANTTPVLTWNPSPGAGAVSYDVAMLNTATQATVCTLSTATTSAVCPALANDATYIWGVTATNSAGSSPPSTGVYFTVAIPPVITNVTSPIASSNSLQRITITGTNFSTQAQGGSLLFTDTAKNPHSSKARPERIVSTSSTQWVYNIDDAADAGTWTVQVINANAQSSNPPTPFIVQ